MLVVDASCLAEIAVDGFRADAIRSRLSHDDDWVAPHVIDVEVLGVIRREHLLGRLDPTAANHAVEALKNWPGERFGHRPLIDRSWQLRNTVRGWDAVYVALAEALDVVLLTTDRRLARAGGPTCSIEVIR